jgi:hypothetical protein
MGCDRLLRSCVPLPPLPRMVQFAACRVGRSAAPVPWLLAADDLSCMLGELPEKRDGFCSAAIQACYGRQDDQLFFQC